MYCRCGREKIRANGHCATCYTLRQQDQRNFAGLRERVLGLQLPGLWGIGEAQAHDRGASPGTAALLALDDDLALRLACHARVHRTRAVLTPMEPLLLELWREQHPKGHE